jgi:signal transduction histidine kinase
VDQGLLHIHQGKTDLFTPADGISGDLSGDNVRFLFEDREGSIWVATANGLDRFREFAIPTFSVQQGLSSRGVSSVLARRDGSIWLGTADGLNRWNKGQVTIYRKRSVRGGTPAGGLTAGQLAEPGTTIREILGTGLPHDELMSLFEDDNENIWVATLGGLAFLKAERFVPVDSVPPGNVLSITGDRAGNVWISHDEGLFHLHQARLVEHIPWANLGHRQVASALLGDAVQGGLWLGFRDGGVAYFKDGQLRSSYGGREGLGGGVVHSFYMHGNGTLWVSTDDGLSRIKDGVVLTLTSHNGLPCNTVHWMTEDDFHAIWLYMACGLVRIARPDFDTWVSHPTQTLQATIFDSSDGVRKHPGISGYSPIVAKATDGRLWFLPADGVSILDPQHLAENKLPPPVRIEQITADMKTYDAGDTLRLPPRVRDLAIDYTALSLVVPDKIRFRVKLEGQDKNWRELVNVRRVEYTNLPPKHYRFRVLACNNSGVWNEEGAAVDFVIPPTWYQTNWFRALCVAAFLALLWALYQLRLRQLAQQFNMRLEERVGERSRVARDLHDTLLQSLHGVMLHFQTGISQLPDHPGEARTAEARKTLEKAMHQAKRAIVEGREAIQGLRSSVVETDDLALAIRTLGKELAANANSTAFQVHLEGTPRNLHPILRDEVYRIAGEAMRNAFRHADAKQIEVEIHYDDRRLRVRVRDDGKGIDPKLLSDEGRQGHFGLRGMRERAKLIGGKLTVWSELDAGTEVELSIPDAHAYTTATDGQQMSLTEKFLAKLSGRGTMKKP